MVDRGEPGLITVDYSHLFPGVVVRADRMADEFDVVFSDGVRTEAADHVDRGCRVRGEHRAGTLLALSTWAR